MSTSQDMLKKLALYGNTPAPVVNGNPQVRIILWGKDGDIISVKTIGRYPFDHNTQTLTFPENFSVEIFVSYATAKGFYQRPDIQKVSIETLSEQAPIDYPSGVLSVVRSKTLSKLQWSEKWVVESTDSGQVSIRLPRVVEFFEVGGTVSYTSVDDIVRHNQN